MKPALVTLEDGGQQATFVAQRILELHEEGASLSDIAILYRAHFHAMEMQLELTRRNIPYTITSGLRFFEQAHIKDVSAHLRLSLNPRDEVAFHRMAKLLPGVGPRSATKMWQEVQAGKGLGQLKVPEKGAKGWSQMVQTLLQLKGKEPSEQVKIVVEGSYGDYVKAKYANLSNHLQIPHLPLKRPLQIHQVQHLSIYLLPPSSHRHRILTVHLLLRRFALRQTHHLTCHQINRRNNEHALNPSPTSCDRPE